VATGVAPCPEWGYEMEESYLRVKWDEGRGSEDVQTGIFLFLEQETEIAIMAEWLPVPLGCRSVCRVL
jgi:hypothetical protein